LDTEIVHHPDGTLSTTVFRKRTHTDRYLDFNSHHPLAHKLAVVNTLFSRAGTHCTFAPDRIKEEQHVTKALTWNGYPEWIIKQLNPGRMLPRQQQDPPSPPKAVATIPYIRNVSESIRRVLAPLEIRTCFKPHQTLRNTLVHVKDHTPQEARTGVVYWIPCSGCPGAYVGQTGRTLGNRLYERKYALTSGHTFKSAVAEHTVDTGHTIDWGGAQVVDSHPNLHQRCILEAWHIQKEPHTINKEKGQLHQIYHHLTQAQARSCTNHHPPPHVQPAM